MSSRVAGRAGLNGLVEHRASLPGRHGEQVALSTAGGPQAEDRQLTARPRRHGPAGCPAMAA